VHGGEDHARATGKAVSAVAERLPAGRLEKGRILDELCAAVTFGAAVWRHLEPGVPPPRIDVSRIPPWLLVAVNGFLALVALAALIGIWFGRTPGVST
jgi:hypothetical protein